MSPDQRTVVEELLKSGQLPALVCTSSLELGIDMGAVDLVIQVESPRSVARGLQRVGRAGHHVGAVSTGRIFPKYRGDLLECAVLAKRMREGAIEATTIPRNPVDVLAQHIVAMCAVEDWTVDQLHQVVKGSYNFQNLSREVLENVLGMLAGHYPSDEFSDLKPRLIWDRATDTLSTRGDARTVAVVNAGTIPDRGLYGVFMGEGGPRVGELDEEMVYESRAGETFLLGATTWRIEQITLDRVIVSPAPGEPGKMPFWKGDGIGRPLEFGRAVGAVTRELVEEKDRDRASTRLQQEHDLDERAARNLLSYLDDQAEATGAVPSDRTIVVERYRDELGDWRVIVLTPFGGQVHAPWAQALEASLAERGGGEVQALWSDDGIALRFTDGEAVPGDDALFPAPEAVEELVVSRLADSTLFASHFRENAARALLLPRRRPGQRTPLWMQRQRSANLLSVAGRYSDFPIILETYRECLRDVFDLPGLIEILADVRSRKIHVASVETEQASPFARSLLFDYIAAYMYEGDAPLAERRAQALTLDRNLLRDLLGEAELRELLDPGAIDQTELELQSLEANRRARTADQLHDVLRRVGDLAFDELEARSRKDAPLGEWLATLQADHRACVVRISGEERWIAIEDAGHYRDALGVAPPLGVPEAFLKPAANALEALLARFARTHAPFHASAPAQRWALPEQHVLNSLERLAQSDGVLAGDFRPGASGREWCHPDVLRIIKRRSLARLREAVEPVDAATYTRFLLQWHGVGSRRRNLDRLREVISQVEGLALPASVLERDILSARVGDYRPALLDELCASGELAWVGRGALGRNDGRIALFRRENLGFLPAPAERPSEPLHDAILHCLGNRGASFFVDLLAATGESANATLEALWDLVWSGHVTNDTLAPVRAVAWPRRATRPGRGRGSVFPPEAGGRWSLTASEAAEQPTRALHALANRLLERYGVVTRETVASESIPGGFSALYPVFKAMEESGRVRRGYFIEGLGASQFALPGAVDRLRSHRDPDAESVPLVLAATDPANPYGTTCSWPEHPTVDRRAFQRTAGACVVLLDGVPIAYLAANAKSVALFRVPDVEDTPILAAEALRAVAPRLLRQTLTIETIDDEAVNQSPHAAAFKASGFQSGYRGLVFRATMGASA
jgi:ATP-dependent Lhr-like helicase